MSTNMGERPPKAQLLTASFDEELGQIVLSGSPTGAAGAVEVSPAPGLLCSLDAVSGQVLEILLEPGDGAGLRDTARSALTWLLGEKAASEVVELDRPEEEVRAEVAASKWLALQRLGLLEGARETDPLVPGSPLFRAEAVILAHDAGLHPLARSYAAEVASGLSTLIESAPRLLADERVLRGAHLVASLAEGTRPEDVERLRRLVEAATEGELIAALANVEGEALEVDHAYVSRELVGITALGSLRGGWGFTTTIDPALVPRATFLLAEDPCQDIYLRPEDGVLFVSVTLAPGATPARAESCRVRLVHPATHRVLSEASLRVDGHRSLAVARLEIGEVEPRELALELVEDGDEPVRGSSLQHLRRALRLGTCALRAERGHPALHPDWDADDWRHAAKDYWYRTASEWAAAGEEMRARIADLLAAGQRIDDSEDWTEPLCVLSASAHEPFLGEGLGDAVASALNGQDE